MTFTVVLLLLEGTAESRKGEENTVGGGGGQCAAKVMSRISTYNGRCVMEALQPPERCCCCRAREFNSAQTIHIAVVYPEKPGNGFFSP